VPATGRRDRGGRRGVEERTDPATGRVTRVAAGPRRELADVPMYVRFEATATKLAPRAYLLPPRAEAGGGVDAPGFAADALDAIEALLRRHGVRTERLAPPGSQASGAGGDVVADVKADVVADAVADVEAYRLASAEREDQVFEGHRTANAAWTVGRARRAFPAGTLRVPLDQPFARVAFQLLDPESDDGLAVWNAYDAWLDAGPGTELPVYAERPAP